MRPLDLVLAAVVASSTRTSPVAPVPPAHVETGNGSVTVSKHLTIMMTYDFDPVQIPWINVLSGDTSNTTVMESVWRKSGHKVAGMLSPPCGVFARRPCAVAPPPMADHNLTCNASSPASGQVFSGGSLAPGQPARDVSACAARCCNARSCAGYAFVGSGDHCKVDSPESTGCCWLKRLGGSMTPWNNGMGGTMHSHAGLPPTPAPQAALLPGWRQKLSVFATKLRSMMEEGSAVGSFLGDELVCGGVPVDAFSIVVNELRSMLPPAAILYANECGAGISRMQAAGGIPSALDLISVDMYSSVGQIEVENAKKYYNREIYPYMLPNQSVMLVPGIFASDPVHCADNNVSCPLASQAQQIVTKLDGYFDWAKKDARVRGFNP